MAETGRSNMVNMNLDTSSLHRHSKSAALHSAMRNAGRAGHLPVTSLSSGRKSPPTCRRRRRNLYIADCDRATKK